MHRFSTLIDMLESAAFDATRRHGFTFLTDRGAEHVNYLEMWYRAQDAAAVLQERGLKRGDRVLMVVPTSPDFPVALFGVLLCGAVPCILPPPAGTGSPAEGFERIRKVRRQIEAVGLITNDKETLNWAAGEPQGWILTPEALRTAAAKPWQPVVVAPDDLAFIQPTSGSTGAPKCVMITHDAVLWNVHQIGEALRSNSDDVMVSWLPLYHDMGLIGCLFHQVYWKYGTVFLSPFRFMRNPAVWLQALSDYRGTISTNPNFAYATALQRIDEQELGGWDLSRLDKGLCGAEPLHPETLRCFVKKFGACRLRERALVPCYGLAEATLAVTMHPVGEPFCTERVLRSALAQNIAQVDDSADTSLVTEIADCGPPVPHARLAIRDEQGEELADGGVGKVWVSSPSLMHGYFNLPDVTAEVLRDGWLDSGDFGYLRNGHLFITGRAKDVVIIRGLKYLPTDFEQAAATVPGVSAGKVVAFGVRNTTAGTEELYVVGEQPKPGTVEVEALREQVMKTVARTTGILPAHVGFLPRNAIPRTTSGKLQRSKAKALYLEQLGRTDLLFA